MTDLAPLLASRLPSAGALAAECVGALVVIVALVWLMRRRADAFPLLVMCALPFRVPISAEGRTVNLLIPLYLVVAAGTLGLLLPRLLARGARPPALAAAPASPRTLAFWTSTTGLQWLLFATVALYALQAIYSDDHTKAAENLAFFYIPFALLFVMLLEVDWTRELLLRCLAVLVGLAVLFAGCLLYTSPSPRD